MARNPSDVSSSGRSDQSGQSRPLDLSGDSPELIAFGLLRYLAQIEQRSSNRPTFDRVWLLDAYAECLAAVKGERNISSAKKPASKR
jgi:hypothetical protein